MGANVAEASVKQWEDSMKVSCCYQVVPQSVIWPTSFAIRLAVLVLMWLRAQARRSSISGRDTRSAVLSYVACIGFRQLREPRLRLNS